MKACLLVSALTLVSASAFAVGDLPGVLTPLQIRSEFARYRNAIADTPCKNLIPLSAETRGGSAPGDEAHYEIYQMAPNASSPPTATLTISWFIESLGITRTTVSFACAAK